MLKKQMIIALFVGGMVGSIQGAAAGRLQKSEGWDELASKMVSEEQVADLVRQAEGNGERVTVDQARSILVKRGAMVQMRLALVARGASSVLK